MSGGAENPSRPLPISPGLVPLPPCTICGEDICGHERVCEAVPGGAVRIGIDVPADGVMREFVLGEVA
jgi:hypothetical protein